MEVKKRKGKSIRITVTPNVEYSIKILKNAVKGIDNDEVKGAVKYLETVAKGGIQPLRGKGCPKIMRIQRY